MGQTEFFTAFERNSKARPHPRRYRYPTPPIRKVWRDNWHPSRR